MSRKDIEARSLVSAFLFDDNGNQLSPVDRPTNKEITDATGYPPIKIIKLVGKLRREGILSPVTPEEVSAQRSKAHLGHEVADGAVEAIKRVNKRRQEEGFSQEERENMSRSKGGIRLKGEALFMRGALIEDVVQLTQMKREQVRLLRQSLVEDTSSNVAKPTKHQQHLELQFSMQRTFRGYSNEEMAAIDLARRCIELGLDRKDIREWQQLHRLYRIYGPASDISIPELFAQKFILEIFMIARKNANAGNREMLDKYFALGATINSRWFYGEDMNKHRAFLSEAVSKDLVRAQRIFPR